jgi:L-rhamnose 1-dehydrogenase
MRLQGKVGIVTGAGGKRGIGRAIALGFAREGANIALADINAEGVADTAREISRLGRRSLAMQLDVTSAAGVRKLVEDTVKQFGKIDILVNNAGFCSFVPFLDISEELWDRTMAVNVKGYFLVGQEVARQMVKQGHGGKIINVSSISAEVSGEEKVHYCASKAAVKLLTQGMALELARYRINVNALAPGTIDTDIIKEDHIKNLVAEERRKSSIPWGRMGTSEDLVSAAIFLASDEAGYVTGSSLLVDGGILAGSLLPSEFRSPKESRQELA